MEKKKEYISDEMSEKIIETTAKLATRDGAHTVTVRKVLQEMGLTNRVFYNRFNNIAEVLEIVYHRTILRIRDSIRTPPSGGTDFFSYVTDVVVESLLLSYEIKMQFNCYVFENDSVSRENFEWWTGEIGKLIDYAKEHGYIKDVDSDVMSYAIWCFCRGYNADAVGRNLPKEQAVEQFRYSFGFLLEGLKKQISG